MTTVIHTSANWVPTSERAQRATHPPVVRPSTRPASSVFVAAAIRVTAAVLGMAACGSLAVALMPDGLSERRENHDAVDGLIRQQLQRMVDGGALSTREPDESLDEYEMRVQSIEKLCQEYEVTVPPVAR